MNPSRLFILRPVATSLLMAAIVLAGGRRVSAAPGFGVAASRLSDDPDHDVLSGRKPGCRGVRHHRAARAAVRAAARLEPDDVHELRRRLGHHAAVRPRSEHRRRRAGGAGIDQRVRHVPAHRPSESSDLQQDQSGGCPDPHPRPRVGDAAAVEGGGSRGHAARAEDLAALGRRPREHQRRAEAGRAHPGEPGVALHGRARRSRMFARPSLPPTSTPPRAASTAGSRRSRLAPTIGCCRAISIAR